MRRFREVFVEQDRPPIYRFASVRRQKRIGTAHIRGCGGGSLQGSIDCFIDFLRGVAK
jgi:hypothetical protein